MAENTPVEGQEPQREHRGRGRSPWLAGVVLIAVGLYLLFSNVGGWQFNNWWAVFILIPAIGALYRAWQAFQGSDGQITSGVTRPAVGGLILLLVALTFLFGLDWGLLGPIILVLLGVGGLLAGLARR